jgi:hypothetical protein
VIATPPLSRLRKGDCDVKRILGLLLIATAPGTTCAYAGAATPRAVVELFTSQGCSSCPPADALFEKLGQDPSLVTLSFPVDYWDYLGWKDTFAKPDYSARQRDYAAARGDRAVYTPQAVINGREHIVGSDGEGIAEAVNADSAHGALPVSLKIEMQGDALVARIGAARDLRETKATVWLVKFSRIETVNIGRGENTGHSVTYSHVVKEMQPIGMWKGEEKTLELPRRPLTGSSNCGYALLLQTSIDGKPGPILGAASFDDTTKF